MYSNTVSTLHASQIQVMAQRTRQAIQAGRSVVDMTLGEPDFATPEHVCEAAARAISRGQTRYTPINGSVELREAIVRKFMRDNALECSIANISVGCGGKQVIYQALLATLDPGDEVLIPAPYWSSYSDIVGMHGGVLRALPTDPQSGYLLEPACLEAAINSRTKWLILNSPSNPSGTAYSADQLRVFADVLRRSLHRDFFILVDDIYEHILFDDRRFVTLAALAPDLRERILTVNGVSKAYAMTGWRVGYACGPLQLIEAMTRIQMQVNSHTSSISQAAAQAALDGPQDELALRCRVYQRRRDLLVRRFRGIPGVHTPNPHGAFYLFPDFRDFLGRVGPGGRLISSDVDLASYLLDEGVAVVPGCGFGMPGFIRLSFATSDENLQRAADHLSAALGRLE